jgi:hypothetical protein
MGTKKRFPGAHGGFNECAFPCGIKVNSDGRIFIRVSWMNPNFLDITRRIESLIWQGSTYFG